MGAVRILFSAISGYGYYYLKTLLEEIPEERAVICGVIDPQPEKSGFYPVILKRGVPVYGDIDSFYNDGHSADLTVIASPIQYHVPQSVAALMAGSNVLVDKPAGVTPDEVNQVIGATHVTGKWAEVGYQWSFSQAIQHLKSDILQGKFGKPLRMKTICLWPRPYDYFNRNNWAGRIQTDSGALVLDSIANNACAHFLHNLFFLCGSEMNRSALPVTVTGERYRAYDIENFDTVLCRAMTENGVEIFFYASHVTEKPVNPSFELEFEGASIILDEETDGIVAQMHDGTEISYGHPDGDHQFKKLFMAIGACHGPVLPVCPPEAALAQTICINALNGLPEPIKTFPASSLVHSPERRFVAGLGKKILEAYAGWGRSLRG